MINLFVRLNKFLHTYRSYLVKQTTVPHAPISDLFVWRSDGDWETYFDLMNIHNIITPLESNDTARTAILFLYNRLGECLCKTHFDLPKIGPRLINVSELVKQYSTDDMGTFAVFHMSPTSELAVKLGASITDRGYVSYRYKSGALRRYVHGNLDAVALVNPQSIEYLMSNSFFKKEYRLQVLMERNKRYQVAFVNASSIPQKIQLNSYDFFQRKSFPVKKFDLLPGGSSLIDVTPESNQYLVIKSHLIMARPLVFEYHNESNVDPYHG